MNVVYYVLSTLYTILLLTQGRPYRMVCEEDVMCRPADDHTGPVLKCLILMIKDESDNPVTVM